MHRTNTTKRALYLFVSAIALWTQVQAATVTSEAFPEYRRLRFEFSSPAQLRVTRTGSTVTMNFNQVVGVSSAEIKEKLGDYVTSVTASSNGKTIVLTLKNSTNIRQFASGKAVGIVIVGTDPTAKKDAPAATPFKHASTGEPVSPKAAASTNKAAPVAEVEQAPAATTANLYTTKKIESSPPAGTPPTDPSKPASPTTPTPAPAPTPTAAPSLLVTTQRTDAGTAIHFPWESRTAAAVYERPRTIWIVFSQTADVHVDRLATILPKQVVRVQQYAYPNATVLRLTTDGTLHAIASQTGTNYTWDVTLKSETAAPALDIPTTIDTSANNPYLLLSVFDTAPPLQFFDPALQDRVIVVPTYETNRGVATAREFPDFSLLATQQGIAITSQRNDLTAEASRQGVRIYAPTPLGVSLVLPLLSADAKPISGLSATSNVLIPYDQWYVAPRDFVKQRLALLATLAKATDDAEPAAIENLMKLYMGGGFVHEAYAHLQIIKKQYPDYYAQHKLALISAACNVYMDRLPEAAQEIAAHELDGQDEAKMWREFIGIFVPPTSAPPVAATGGAAAPVPAPTNSVATAPPIGAVTKDTGSEDDSFPGFDFAAYNKKFIRYYPPRLRQRMVLTLANADVNQHRENAVLAMFSTLADSGILPHAIDNEAQVWLAKLAARKNRIDDALKMLDKISADPINVHAQMNARFNGVMVRYTQGKIDANAATSALESIRLSWRGDRLEHDILTALAQIYLDHKQYGDTLRTWKILLDAFPTSPDVLTLSADMSALFEQLFLQGQADTMAPLESLATFYEFRELTPVGERGDLMIQKLADRLASVDLLDRAIQLLQSQIKFRVSGETRARVGARLAILQLVNRQPQDALNTIETTNFTGSAAELQLQRAEISAQALSQLNRSEEALSIIANDRSESASLLRLDIYWGTKDWANVINQAEDLLGSRPNLTVPLNTKETDILLKLVL
ncbi:MAG: hypothetical protein B7X02_00885, partial [Rhodospirillales bacterium 12-54-5]